MSFLGSKKLKSVISSYQFFMTNMIKCGKNEGDYLFPSVDTASRLKTQPSNDNKKLPRRVVNWNQKTTGNAIFSSCIILVIKNL